MVLTEEQRTVHAIELARRMVTAVHDYTANELRGYEDSGELWSQAMGLVFTALTPIYPSIGEQMRKQLMAWLANEGAKHR